MASVNQITLLGRVGKDPDVKHLDSGSSVANFTLATSDIWKDKTGERKESTQWHNITCWGYIADNVEKYVQKGDQICVTGKLQYDQYVKDGMKHTIAKIKVDQLVLLGNKKSDQKQDYETHQLPINDQVSDTDNDLPFIITFLIGISGLLPYFL